MTIKDLKKGDRFKFNSDTYEVKRKYIDDDKPLLALRERDNYDDEFSWEGLEIEKLKPNAKGEAK